MLNQVTLNYFFWFVEYLKKNTRESHAIPRKINMWLPCQLKIGKYDSSETATEVSGYRVVHMSTMVRAYHNASVHHGQLSPECLHFLIALASLETTRGSSVEEVFGCTRCGYRSEKYKLYEEIPQNKRGRNPSSLNVSLQLTSYNTSISPTGIRRLLSSMNLPAPSASGFQKSSNTQINLLDPTHL